MFTTKPKFYKKILEKLYEIYNQNHQSSQTPLDFLSKNILIIEKKD